MKYYQQYFLRTLGGLFYPSAVQNVPVLVLEQFKAFSYSCRYNKNDNIHKNEVQNIGFGIPIKSVQKQRNWTVVVRTVILGKYNIGF